jgi:hypothetical protein
VELYERGEYIVNQTKGVDEIKQYNDQIYDDIIISNLVYLQNRLEWLNGIKDRGDHIIVILRINSARVKLFAEHLDGDYEWREMYDEPCLCGVARKDCVYEYSGISKRVINKLKSSGDAILIAHRNGFKVISSKKYSTP